MCFVRLTALDGMPIYVNIARVDAIVHDGEYTLLITSSESVRVIESPETILEIACKGE